MRRAAVQYFGGRIKPFKLEEVADYFSVSLHTVQRWRRDLKLRCFVQAGTTRVAVEEVYALVSSRTI